MSLSADTARHLLQALTGNGPANEAISAINNGAAIAAQSPFVVAAVIVATGTSQTTDFGALVVGDKVIVIAASAGNSHFVTVSVAGTLGEAAVSGSLYIALRAASLPAASALNTSGV